MQDKETKPPLFCRSILDRIVSQNEFPMPSVHQQGDQKTGSLDYYTGRMRGFHVIYLADTSMPVQTPVSDIDEPVGTSMQYSIGHVFFQGRSCPVSDVDEPVGTSFIVQLAMCFPRANFPCLRCGRACWDTLHVFNYHCSFSTNRTGVPCL